MFSSISLAMYPIWFSLFGLAVGVLGAFAGFVERKVVCELMYQCNVPTAIDRWTRAIDRLTPLRFF
eukprot:SAG11_NODE_21009_length_434_cov_0.611940_2_plen_65_part_01